MVVLAQLVRASVCGTEGRGFEPHIPPQFLKAVQMDCFFCLKYWLLTIYIILGIKSKSCGLRMFLSIQLSKAIQEELCASYSSKLASECLYFGVERLG